MSAACLARRAAMMVSPPVPQSIGPSHDALDATITAVDWAGAAIDLDARGHALIGLLLDPDQCAALTGLYDAEGERIFRSRVMMGRHGFGRGEYRYFAYPLPPLIGRLRSGLYPHLASIANRWAEASDQDGRFPEMHDEFIARCRAAGQSRPTPLLLRYGPDDYNCLHRDLYGDLVFPLQMAILLSEPKIDFTGGEFVLTEQRPRMQSRVDVVPMTQGAGVVFAVNHRPILRAGGRGYYRVAMRHGVSRLLSGRRHTLGVIFHDAIQDIFLKNGSQWSFVCPISDQSATNGAPKELPIFKIR